MCALDARNHRNELAGESRVFTAFGEPISPTTDRFGYVGAHGYQRDPDFQFLHVGARWYDPASARFLQRDPIGITGGTNVYGYVWGIAGSLIDPEGQYPRGGLEMQAVYNGLRDQGYSRSAAATTIADMTRTEGTVVVVGMAAVAVGAVVYTGVASIAPVLVTTAGTGAVSLGTRDPGFLRWGQGVISKAGQTFETGWRIAMGGPRGGWPFHIHIHRNNWWKFWDWFMSCG